MTAPWIGALAALSCPGENPAIFANSRAAGAYTGLAARRCRGAEALPAIMPAMSRDGSAFDPKTTLA
jgi:hypothetical protein